jgi:hypothetical protein
MSTTDADSIVSKQEPKPKPTHEGYLRAASSMLDSACDSMNREGYLIVGRYLRDVSRDLLRPIDELQARAIEHADLETKAPDRLSELDRLSVAEAVWRSEALAGRLTIASLHVELARLGMELARANEPLLRDAQRAAAAQKERIEGKYGAGAALDLVTGKITR